MGATPLPLRRISTDSENLRNVSCATFESSLGVGRQKCCQLSGIFSCWGSGYRDLSWEALENSKQTWNGFELRWPMVDTQESLSDRVTPKYITYISTTSIIQCLGF